MYKLKVLLLFRSCRNIWLKIKCSLWSGWHSGRTTTPSYRIYMIYSQYDIGYMAHQTKVTLDSQKRVTKTNRIDFFDWINFASCTHLQAYIFIRMCTPLHVRWYFLVFQMNSNNSTIYLFRLPVRPSWYWRVKHHNWTIEFENKMGTRHELFRWAQDAIESS